MENDDIKFLDDSEVVDDIKFLDDSEVVIDEEPVPSCDICSFIAKDLDTVILHDSRRKKHSVVICEVCFGTPYVLDSYLNPDQYSADSRRILSSLAYLTNVILEKHDS